MQKLFESAKCRVKVSNLCISPQKIGYGEEIRLSCPNCCSHEDDYDYITALYYIYVKFDENAPYTVNKDFSVEI